MRIISPDDVTAEYRKGILCIDSSGEDGEYRLQIDLLMLNDILGAVLNRIRIDGKPASFVTWNANDDCVELYTEDQLPFNKE